MSGPHDDEVLGWIADMRADVEAGPEIYRPGAFWDSLMADNERMIAATGIENFKRSISNNYFNWLVIAPRDPQLRAALIRFLRKPSLDVLKTRLHDADGLWTQNSTEALELRGLKAAIYRFFVGTLWHLAQDEDSRGLCARLEEPAAGNPVGISYRGRPISQDLANSVIEFSFVDRRAGLPPGARVAELGAGYGRLAHVHAEAGAAYCIFDIPPALAVSQWYLREVLGADRIIPFSADASPSDIERRLKPGMVAFCTPGQLEHFPDGWFALTQTISTLPEMPGAQAARFLELLIAKSSSALFLKQWKSWENVQDGAHLTEAASYVPPSGWELAARREDPVQPQFFNQLWRRRPT